MSKKKGFKLIYDFVLGHIHSHPGLHGANGPWIGHPCLVLFISAVLVSQLSLLTPALIGGERSMLLLHDAELSVKNASVGSGLVTVYSFFSFGL